MSEDLIRRIEEHMDDFAEYERPDASQEPEKREAAIEARRGAVGVVLDAIDAAGYRVEGRQFLKELKESNNRRLERIRTLEQQVRDDAVKIEVLTQQLTQVETAVDLAGVTRARTSDPVSRVQTMGRMLADLKNKADATAAGGIDDSPEGLEAEAEVAEKPEAVCLICGAKVPTSGPCPGCGVDPDAYKRKPWEPHDMPRPDERPGERPEVPTPPMPRDPDKDGSTG